MLSRARKALRSLGWADTLCFAADRVLQRLSFGTARLVKYYYVAQPVSPGTASAPASAGTRMYVAEQVDDVIRQAPRPLDTLRDRFAQGSRCVVAERNGELAGFIWLCPGRYREDTVRGVYRWTPVAAAVWDFDVFIAPPYRMGRLFARLWARAHELLASENVGWTLSRIEAFNPDSLRAHRRLGARDLARGWFLIVGRLQCTFSTMAPCCHLSLREADAPQLCFDLQSLRHDGEAHEVGSTGVVRPPG